MNCAGSARRAHANGWGPHATEEAVRKLTDELYNGPVHECAGMETPVEKLRRERMSAANRALVGKGAAK